jgi:hypothetical protein
MLNCSGALLPRRKPSRKATLATALPRDLDRAHQDQRDQRKHGRDCRDDGREIEIGAQRRIRTTDTRIFSPLLYQLSYLGLFRLTNTRAPDFNESTVGAP